MNYFLALLDATPPLITTSDDKQFPWAVMFIFALVVIFIAVAAIFRGKNDNERKKTDEAPSQKVVLICCPVCGCRELAFVSEYHREIGLHLARDLALLGILGMLIKDFIDILQTKASNWGDGWFIAGFVLLALLALFLHIKILISESRSHIQAICRDCGFTWEYQ